MTSPFPALKPEALVVTFVLEAGLRTDVLQAEIQVVAAAAQNAGMRIAGGDTKLSSTAKPDSMYIATTGLGSTAARRRDRSAIGASR